MRVLWTIGIVWSFACSERQAPPPSDPSLEAVIVEVKAIPAPPPTPPPAPPPAPPAAPPKKVVKKRPAAEPKDPGLDPNPYLYNK